MKLLLENWRNYLAESNKKTGTLNSDYPGYVELYSPYSENKEQAKVGVAGDHAEILGSWSDKGMKWLEVDIDGIKGWINSTELTLDKNEAEIKVWTPEEVRNELFPTMPDHVLGDMIREGFASFLEDRAQDITEVGLEELLSTDEWGKGWYDRYNLNWAQEPAVLDVSWEDLGEKEQKFLMDKHKGLNKDFPKEDQDARIADMKERFPGLGKGDHEPVIVKMEGDKIVDIIGGRHRTFTAFLINDFGPIKLNAYVGTD